MGDYVQTLVDECYQIDKNVNSGFPIEFSVPHMIVERMKFFSAILSVAVCDPILNIPIRFDSGRIVTANEVSLIDGQSVGPMVINFNYPDIVVPICEKHEWAVQDKQDPEGPCYDPKSSPSFLYCDSGKDQCFDRMSPQLSCPRTLPANKWSLESSTLTEHSILTGGSVTTIHAFEFFSTFAKHSLVPMKGSISVQSGILGLAPARLSCRNETFVSKLKAQYMEIGQDSVSFFQDIPKANNVTWTAPYHLVPVNVSSVQGKYAFNMINPSVCGADVLGLNVSAHWTAIVDPAEECLVVPPFIADNMHAWEGGDKNLKFRVNQDSEDWISIPLGKVCVTNLPDSDLANSFESTGSHPIVFGSTVIAAISMTTAIGFETDAPYRIRFPTFGDIPTSTCPIPRPICKGQQTYFEPRNVCLDPVCGSFFLTQLDKESRECVWQPVVPYIAYSLILGYIVLELFAFRLQNRAVDILRTACERSTGESTT